MHNLFIVVPSFNPDEKIIGLVKELIANGLTDILIVNDGSRLDCLDYFEQAKKLGCTVIGHAVNLGKGRGLKTAYNYLLTEYGEDIFAVFADADGQHAVKDILAVSKKLFENTNSMIMGCRQFEDKTIPSRSRFGNKVTRNVFRVLCGVRVSDTQTGLRGLSGKTMKKFLSTKGERFEFEMNMLIEAGQKDVTLLEVPISTIYIEENKTSNFNPLKDSIKIYAVFAKFLLSSALSFLVDILLFALFVFLLDGFVEKYYAILLATLGARICSSLVNYTINKNTVFKAKSKNVKTILRYYILCAVQLICSGLLVSGIFMLIPVIKETVIKVVVDLVLFTISFQIQREWVFKEK